MEKTPEISVITLTYNRAGLLPRAVNSVLNQTFKDFELIVVNNASTDNTEEVIKSFSDPRIVYKKNTENNALGGKNIGLDAAKGKYVTFLDDDDEFLPDALEIISAEFAKLYPLGVKMLWLDCVDAESGTYSGSGTEKEGYVSYQDNICGKITGDRQVAIDRSVIGNHRFDPHLWGGMTGLFFITLLRDNKTFYVPKVVTRVYRRHSAGRNFNPEASLKNIPQIILTWQSFLEQYGEDIKHFCPVVYGQNQATVGFYQILNGQKKEGRKNIRKSFSFDFSIKYGLLFLLSFFFLTRIK